MRTAVAVLLAGLVVFVGVVIGLLTNWYRYSLSLEDWFVVVPLAAGLALVGTMLVRALAATELRAPRVALLAAAVLGVVLVGALAMRESLGGYFPTIQANDVVRGPEQTLVVGGRSLRYRVELVNPFSRRHRERLVLEEPKGEVEIEVPLFKKGEKVSGFFGPRSGSDWCSLEAGATEHEFILKTTEFLAKGIFVVDAERRKATAVPDPR